MQGIDKLDPLFYHAFVAETASERRTSDEREQRIAQLETELVQARSQLADLGRELGQLRQAYRRALEQLALMRRRMFVAKTERSEVPPQEQLRFDEMLAELAELEKKIDAAENALGVGDSPDEGEEDDEGDESSEGESKGGGEKKKRPGRRKLAESDLPVERIELLDPTLEGKVERVGFDEQSRLAYQRGGHRHLIIATAVYKVPVVAQQATCEAQTAHVTAVDEPVAALDAVPSAEALTPTRACEGSVEAADSPTCGATAIRAKLRPPQFEYVRVPKPRELSPRALLAPSMIAHLLVSKYVMGTPFYRLERQMAFEGAPLDRGTMCRYGEHAGAVVGAIVWAMRDEALATAFCLSTDATGALIQPEALGDGKAQKCKRGHFFVVLADRDHVFFEYQERHTSAAVCEMFKGYRGYIQADASAVYDALFRGAASDSKTGPPPTEVGCWAHCRRKFWEAATCKHPLGVEGLKKIDALFAADAKLGKLPPSKRHTMRQKYVRPLVEEFFQWVTQKHMDVLERGLMGAALGYALRQREPLCRFLENGRLRLDNNLSENALRVIATGRKAWLFFGSDDHAESAANLLSLFASCRLHGLDPEAYLVEVLRLMPYWPRDRYIELCPRDWRRTRARLDKRELARDLGPITIPPALPPQEQPLPN